MSSRYGIELTRDGSGVRLLLQGEIDMNAAGCVAHVGEQAVAERPGRIVLDLASVTFLDSAGIAAFVAIRNAAVDGAIPVALAPGPGNVMRVLTIAGLVDVFEADV